MRAPRPPLSCRVEAAPAGQELCLAPDQGVCRRLTSSHHFLQSSSPQDSDLHPGLLEGDSLFLKYVHCRPKLGRGAHIS